MGRLVASGLLPAFEPPKWVTPSLHRGIWSPAIGAQAPRIDPRNLGPDQALLIYSSTSTEYSITTTQPRPPPKEEVVTSHTCEIIKKSKYRCSFPCRCRRPRIRIWELDSDKVLYEEGGGGRKGPLTISSSSKHQWILAMKPFSRLGIVPLQQTRYIPTVRRTMPF